MCIYIVLLEQLYRDDDYIVRQSICSCCKIELNYKELTLIFFLKNQ